MTQNHTLELIQFFKENTSRECIMDIEKLFTGNSNDEKIKKFLHGIALKYAVELYHKGMTI